MVTLKDFRMITAAPRISYTCFFADCDYETASQDDEGMLEAWENSDAIVIDINVCNDTLFVECEITMKD